MTTLPEPTLQELKNYETFHQSPKFVVRYKQTLMTDDPKHRVVTIKHYGYFVTKNEAENHFFNLKRYYKWRRNTYAREFIGVLTLKEFLQHGKKKWFKRKETKNDR